MELMLNLICLESTESINYRNPALLSHFDIQHINKIEKM